MSSRDLHVPFYEKDLAKGLGARWDAQRKTWYAPDGTDASRFSRWFPQPARITLRAAHYFIAATQCICWQCERVSGAWGFVLPPGHEAWTELDAAPPHVQSDAQYEEWVQSDASVGWVEQDSAAVALRVRHIPESVQRRIAAVTGAYRHDFSMTLQSFYWMNHCTACGMKQGDFELIEEYDAPFYPIHDAARIVLRPVFEAFHVEANSISYEPGVFAHMTRMEP